MAALQLSDHLGRSVALGMATPGAHRGVAAVTPVGHCSVPGTPASLLQQIGESPSKASDAGEWADDVDLCKKCEEPMGIEEDDKAMKIMTHRACTNNYKGLTRRWEKEPAVKIWWESQTQEKRIAWYVQHRALNKKKDAKKTLTVCCEIAERNSAGNRSEDVDLYIPYSEWMLPKVILCGNSVACLRRIEGEWNALLLTNHPKVFKRGEWHVHKFGGVRSTTYQDSSTEASVTSTAQPTTSEGLAAMQENHRTVVQNRVSQLASHAAAQASASIVDQKSWEAPRSSVRGEVSASFSATSSGHIEGLMFEAQRADEELSDMQVIVWVMVMTIKMMTMPIKTR